VLPKEFEASSLYYVMLPDIKNLTALLEVHRFRQLIPLIRDLTLIGALSNPGLRPQMRTTIPTLHKYSALPSTLHPLQRTISEYCLREQTMFTVRIIRTHKHVVRTKRKVFIVQPGGTHTNH
jgi:hypothetical protein